MKISELIAILETIRVNHNNEDLNVMFSVRDHYTRWGNDATPSFDVEGGLWNGVRTNNGTVKLDVHLDEAKDFATREMKYPKVTFRKK